MAANPPTFQELLQGGISTATHVIKKETRDVYASYFKKFCAFRIANEYPDPAVVRHHELPSLLVAFMESVSASAVVSHQTAEKIRAAVANYYGSYERRDAAGPEKWMVITDAAGNKFGMGNPAKDAFVRQFMRGLKKRKNTEFIQRQATPISLDVLRVLHTHLAQASGFTDATKFWFAAVSSFAFYGMCRINEVLSLRWKNLTIDLTRPNKANTEKVISFATYKLEGRKTEVAEGRCYNLHKLSEYEKPIDAYTHLMTWLRFVEANTDHSWSDTDFVFPALAKISKKVLKTSDGGTGCENARIEWGKKMSEQAFITLLNCGVRDLNRNGSSVRGYVRAEWRDIWFTSHTFRRAGAQYRFMFSAPEHRWSLRMVKWRAGWTQNESAETLVRYLLDQVGTDEDKQLADCLAPDRESHVGCPTTYTGKKRNASPTPVKTTTADAIETRLKMIKASIKALEDKIGLLVPQFQNSNANATSEDTSSATEPISILPPAKDWRDMYKMYWQADPARHLFISVCEWTHEDKNKSGAIPSHISVAKLIATDVETFALTKGIANPRGVSEQTLSEFAAYYTSHWVKDTATTGLNVLTIDTLARYIRLDNKRRLQKTRHAYL